MEKMVEAAITAWEKGEQTLVTSGQGGVVADDDLVYLEDLGSLGDSSGFASKGDFVALSPGHGDPGPGASLSNGLGGGSPQAMAPAGISGHPGLDPARVTGDFPAVVDLEPGVAFAGGARMYWGRFITTGVLDLTLVGAGEDRYELRLAGLGLECRDVIAGADVSRSRCAEPEFRLGGVVDVSVAFTEDATGVRPLVGAGYRLGDAATAFGAVGVTGRFESGAPWYARLLVGRRFIQLHFGIAGG